MSQLLEVRFSLEGAIREDKDTGCFVSYCRALDVYSAGRTRPEAKKALSSAIDLFVRVCYDRGILDRVLKQRGFASAVGPTAHAVPASDFIAVVEAAHQGEYDDVFQVEVPLHLIANQTTGGAPTCLQ